VGLLQTGGRRGGVRLGTPGTRVHLFFRAVARRLIAVFLLEAAAASSDLADADWPLDRHFLPRTALRALSSLAVALRTPLEICRLSVVQDGAGASRRLPADSRLPARRQDELDAQLRRLGRALFGFLLHLIPQRCSCETTGQSSMPFAHGRRA